MREMIGQYVRYTIPGESEDSFGCGWVSVIDKQKAQIQCDDGDCYTRIATIPLTSILEVMPNKMMPLH